MLSDFSRRCFRWEGEKVLLDASEVLLESLFCESLKIRERFVRRWVDAATVVMNCSRLVLDYIHEADEM